MHSIRTRLRCVFMALVILLPATASVASAAPPARRIAVMPLRNLGVEEDVASSLLGFLRAEVAKIPGVTLVELGRFGKPMGGDCKDARCLAAAGLRMGADEVVYGTVAGMGDAYSIDLKRVIVRGAREDGRITDMLAGERELLIDGVRASAYKLLVPDKYVGQIQVLMPERGAEVFVDGRSVGPTPLKGPIPAVAPGKHALKIVKRGFADFDKWVDVKFSRVSVVRVDLKNSSITGVMFATEAAPEWLAPTIVPPEPEPAVQAPVAAPVEAKQGLGSRRVTALWIAGGGAALVGGGAVFGLLAQGSRNDVARLQVDGGPVRPADAAEAEKLESSVHANALAADVLYVAGGAAIVTGALMWLAGGTEPGTSVVPTAGGVAVAGRF